jgi:hypothetical protein
MISSASYGLSSRIRIFNASVILPTGFFRNLGFKNGPGARY